MITDPIADMLTRIRNGIMASNKTVDIPRSNLKVELARVLKEEGYIADYTISEDFPPMITVTLKYYGPRRQRRSVITSLERVSKPGRRVYVGQQEIPWVLSGMGIAVLSTSHGVMTGQQARRKGIGGEVLCYIK